MQRGINVQIYCNVQLMRFCVFQSSQRFIHLLLHATGVMSIFTRCYLHERHTISLQRNLQSEFFNEGVRSENQSAFDSED